MFSEIGKVNELTEVILFKLNPGRIEKFSIVYIIWTWNSRLGY